MLKWAKPKWLVGRAAEAELLFLCLGDMASARNVHCNLMLLLQSLRFAFLPTIPHCLFSSPTHPLFFHACSSSAPLGPKLPPDCFSYAHTRRWSPKKECRDSRPSLWGSRDRRADASTGCVRTDHVSLRSCMCSVRSRQSGEMVYLIFHGGH